MTTTKSEPTTKSKPDHDVKATSTHRAPPARENTTDATRGEPLAQRAHARRAELQKALAKLPEAELRARNDLTLALGSIDELLTGDSAHLSDTTADAINRWLETSKHLGEMTPKPRAAGGH